MTSNVTNQYVCIEKDQLQEHSESLAELKAKSKYKEGRINELIEDNKRIEGKIDKLTETVNSIMLHSIQDDNNLNQRVTALESKQETLYKLLLATPAIIALLGVIAVYLNYVH